MCGSVCGSVAMVCVWLCASLNLREGECAELEGRYAP